MDITRNTYVEVNLRNVEDNVKKVIQKYTDYKYYIGVVKANCYGHDDIKTVQAIIDGGCNYLAVATLDEALYIRKYLKDIDILCLGVIPVKYINNAIENNITITINSLEYIKELIKQNVRNIKCHLKINTGMNRLGIKNIEEIEKTIDIAKKYNYNLEGIYTHIYMATDEDLYIKQKNKFENIINLIDGKNIFKIIHMSASEALSLYKKPEFVNGCRLGIIMYGFSSIKELKLKSTFKLVSEVIQINSLSSNETVGYNGIYKATENNEKIAVVAIGYDDGIIRKNTGRYVYINDKRYQIVGNVCMDMLFVKVDDNVKVHDKVEILRDINHIEETAKYLDTIPYEILCTVGNRVKRIYIK